MDVRSRHRTNTRSTRFVLGKASDIDDGHEVIMWIRCLGGERLPTASYTLRPNLNKLFFSPRSSSERKGIEIFCRMFSTHQPTAHLRSRYRINPRVTRFVSCKASEHRWRPPKFDVDPWSRGREVARDVLRSLPKPEKYLFFAIGKGSRFICFIYTSNQMFFLRRLAGARHVSPAFV